MYCLWEGRQRYILVGPKRLALSGVMIFASEGSSRGQRANGKHARLTLPLHSKYPKSPIASGTPSVY